LDCSECHGDGVYAGKPTDCYSCHSDNYQVAPNHVVENFSHSCEQCHSTAAWLPATFDHSSFVLTGAHIGLDCSLCHGGGIYTGLPSDCNDCHNSDYQAAPDHASLGFPLNCEECHVTTAWTPANFLHDFPLSGKHGDLSCAECHTSGSIQTFSCILCHAHPQADMADKHSGVSGYSYTSPACYQCHPDGRD